MCKHSLFYIFILDKKTKNFEKGLDKSFFLCPGGFMPGRRCQISSPLYNTTFFLSSQEIFQIFFCQFFSPSSSLYARRPAVKFYALSNFNKPAANQLRLSNFNSSYISCKFKQLSNFIAAAIFFIFIFPLLL